MTPVRAPPNSPSASRAIVASSSRPMSSLYSSWMASAVATSRAADEDSPAPCGMSPRIVMSIPPSAQPRSTSAAITPLG